MSEWLKEHAWKACVPDKGTVGSNPTLSADNLIKSSIRFLNKLSFLLMFEKFLITEQKWRQIFLIF